MRHILSCFLVVIFFGVCAVSAEVNSEKGVSETVVNYDYNDSSIKVRVGFFNMPPISFINENGLPDGLNIDLLNHIAEENSWELEYVFGNFLECFNRLQSGEIDLIAALAYRPERKGLVSFSRESVFVLHGQLYVRADGVLWGVEDLQGRKIGIVKGDVAGTHFKQMLSESNVSCEFVEFDDYESTFSAVASMEVDAGVVIHTYGLNKADDFNLIETHINFISSTACFATKFGDDLNLLSEIDEQLLFWKHHSDSFYFDMVEKWLIKSHHKHHNLAFLKPLIFCFVVLLALAAIGFVLVIVLRHMVKVRTHELERQFKIKKAIIDGFPGYFASIKNGSIVLWNDCFCDFSKVDPKDFKDTEFKDLFSENSDEIADFINTCLENGQASIDVELFNHSLGRRVPLLVSGKRVEIDGEAYVISVSIDITRQRKIEEILHRLSTIVYVADELITIVGKDRKIIYVNPAFEKKTGFSSEELVGQFAEKFRNRDQDMSIFSDIWETLESGKIIKCCHKNIKKNGMNYIVEATYSPVLDMKGNVEYYVTVQRDISEQILADQKLKESQKLESVSVVAGGVAHELNNMLTPIMGYSQILMDDADLPDRFKVLIKKINSATLLSRDLIASLVKFSRLSGSEMESFDLNDFILNNDKMMRKLCPSNLKVELSLEKVPMPILGDQSDIEQVLTNLLMNAKDAMPNGGTISLSTKLLKSDDLEKTRHYLKEGFDYIQLSFRDTGCGIEKENLELIFDPFYTTKQFDRVIGMGLPTVHRIVHKFDGSISVDSVVGEGTCFNIVLPLDRSMVVEKTVVEQSDEKKCNCDQEIWFVEDDDLIREMMTNALIKNGFSVCSFESAKDCSEFSLANRSAPKLLITDMEFKESDFNGYMLAEFMLQQSAECKVIFISGYDRGAMSENELVKSNALFLKKPFGISGLLSAISAQLNV